MDANGDLTVAASTPSGTYTITYQLCETGATPANCTTATATVVVVTPINADNDDLTSNPINGYEGGIPGNIFTNNGNGQDTLNNIIIDPSQIIISLVNNGGVVGLFIASNGDVIIPSGTPAGNYVITYSICEVLNPSNCDTATITIVVTAPLIDAVDDLNNNVINSGQGATISLYLNDRLNQNSLIPIEVTFTLLNNGGINGAIINSSGFLTVPAGTAPGTYTIVYQICDIINPNNCDTAIAIIAVECEHIIIHNAFTPNGDGFNQFFNIENIENSVCYVSNTVEIYNRWGVLVYETRDYDNNARRFEGLSEGRVTIKKSEVLPTGVYFYIISCKTFDGQTVNKQGYLYLTR